jgi:Antibiotic biosynthesis monooxygenase
VALSEETGERRPVHLAVRYYRVDPDSVDEVIRRINEGFVPTISDAPGFLAYYALDAEDGVLATVSVFEDRSGAEESIRMAKDYVNEDLSSLIPDPPEVMAGEVVVHEASEEEEQGGYASIRRYQINQGATSEALKQFHEGIVPVLDESPGFVAYYGLEAENEIAAFNIFEDRSGAEESNQVAADYVNENLSSILPLPPEITVGEIAIYKTK